MKNDELAPEDDEEDEDSKNIVLPPPKLSINVHSSDPMEVTVTKTCLEVLNNLAKVGSRERVRMEKYVVKLLVMRCDLALQSYCYNDSFIDNMLSLLCNTSSVSERDDMDQLRKPQSGDLVN